MNFLELVLCGIAIYTVFSIIRVLLGPSIWDRLLCLNVVSAKIIMAIVLLSVISNQDYLLDIALIYAFLGFLGTVLIARFIEKRGD
ncbi:MAG: multicomponent Na+:H+ antiporter subunit [Eubacteriaceae bacterium]|jgi:multicomponent Na+:H+ antiporter subunit F|nr:multicomponent Na+:H+ antiporter subunit [Eubacteriaceae bacterium]MDK2904548.1 multicomponent Na+:H+ antiporter subunit [Eubacteriaceae bacterium]MDK2935680.1 multicomponent Na+:H+ antiporter subunit [Eubacteriaceae bacterium]MDK2962092.1 multicomponent Na+:H+ antiporter subunit [Eubacteriaceae bacterium]MDN5306832.1 multicomponent Na+:H+ antiporter subunit [Eubacteriaceae bacterium]